MFKFKQQWINRSAFREWYDGFVPLISINNALERRNLDIKENYTFCERVSVPSFFLKPLTFPLPTMDEYKAAWKYNELSPEITDEPIGGKQRREESGRQEMVER
uniref:Uncharacterized protein n=1 Tax=Ditylenchus dipsaci TaxID=166011 RepID=A0A915CQB8_9BILA